MRGLLKKLLRPPFNEVVELTHVKIYIADDTLVLTGANLSQNYFTERQDRYMVVRDAATCDFFEELVDSIGDSCSELTHDGIARQLRHHFGPFWARVFWRVAQLHLAPHVAVCHALLGAYADRVLIGAWTPML